MSNAKHDKGGRPSKYHRDYCSMLIKHMGDQGLSYETFAAVIDVSVDTLYQWERKYKAFSEAKKEAFVKNKLWWERMGIVGMTGTNKDKVPNFNPTVWIFNMKNRHQWRDRIETEHKGKIDGTININGQIVALIEQLEGGIPREPGEDDGSV